MKANSDDEIELTGVVIEKAFGTGSKSEHTAIFLQTADGDYQLRRMGGNPFSDPELKNLVGEKVVARGKGNQSLFVASSIEKKE